MSQELPKITVVIAARPGQTQVLAVESSRQLDYPTDKLEIILARGTQPAAQRNAAVKEAAGEWIYFLDDDSTPHRDNLRRMLCHLSNPKVEMIGGPNLCPPEAPVLEQLFALVMSAWLAFGPSRARYAPVGAVRESGEKELILCNLIARRSTLLALGGFDETLYPNEENALMDALRDRGGVMIYDPEFYVYRRPRPTLKAFAKMLMTYGRGRAEQFRLHPTLGSAPNFEPPLFCVYLAVAAFFRGWTLWPLALYAVVVLAQALAMGHASLAMRLGTAPLIFLTHLLYGAGFWRGLVSPFRSASRQGPGVVMLEKKPNP
jgi:glycosyltransferase involved in cell wall biosynthesis